MAKEKNFSLKDQLFNEKKLQKIANELQSVYKSFDKEKFVDITFAKFPELELKQRVVWIRENLQENLPNDFKKAIQIIIKSLPPKLDPNLTDNDFGDFIYLPYADFVAAYGLKKEYLDLSFNAFKEITMRFSVEDSIRYFINEFPNETLQKLEEWSKDENYHVRRLVSEGTRPKLPWASKINLDVDVPIPLLDNLFYDKTRYVTRSVANHLNDISKTNPELVISTLKRWQYSKKQTDTEMKFITKHSLRTLIKTGNPSALELLGFSQNPDIEISKLSLKSNRVKMGEAAEFDFEVVAKSDANLIIDYILYFQNKSGEMKNKKVYKITQLKLKKGQSEKITKNHLLREMTTRTLYGGTHKIELQINGKIVDSIEFELNV